MTKPNPIQASSAAIDLRQRAARARDAAGRFIRRASLSEVTAAAKFSAAPLAGTQPPAAEEVNWHAPPPGFMASPTIEPFGFVRIPEGISIELGRLHGVALAEFGRRVKAGMASEAKERLRQELHLDVLSRAGSGRGEFAVPANAPNLVDMVNLASATLSELLTVRDTAKCLGDVAYAFSWGERCRGAMDHGSAGMGTAAHRLVTSLGDALTAVESAAEREAERRSAGKRCDRKTRLYTLAPSVIDNEDPDELEAFAHELLDHATAQREGR